MPKGTLQDKTTMRECVTALKRTLGHKDYYDLPLELQEYWRDNEETLKQLCMEARASVVQEFMKARRSPLRFAKWWPYGDVSKAMLDGKVLMLLVEKGKEREWKEKYEVIDVPEVREMLSRKKFQNREQAGEYEEVYQDEVNDRMKHGIREDEQSHR